MGVAPDLLDRLRRACAEDVADGQPTYAEDSDVPAPREAWSLDTPEAVAATAPHLPRDGRARRLLASALLQGGEVRLPLPSRLHLELTNRCNSRCRICLRTVAPQPEQDMPLELVERAVTPLPGLRSVALQVNGEPLLYPRLDHVLRLLADRGVTTEMNTNGIALRRRRVVSILHGGLDALHVSMDAANSDTYQHIRGVDAFGRVVGNLERFLKLRGPWPARPRVTLWMTATRHNITELPALVELAARTGADGVMLQRLVLFGDGLATEDSSLHARLARWQACAIEEARRLAERLGVELLTCGGHTPATMLGASPDPSPWRSCRRPWESSVVLANGDVVPCCISTFTDARPHITMGNLYRADWPEIWNGPDYDEHRAALLCGEGPGACLGCGTRWSL